jgi:hypothetical protein
MSSAINRDPRPWNNITFFKRNINNSLLYELESNKINHIIRGEEETLHEYRNRINEYESVLDNVHNSV